jgi:hypothetical protein
MNNIQIGMTLIGFAGILLTAFTYILHSHLIQLHERIKKIETHLNDYQMYLDIIELQKNVKKIRGESNEP